MLAIIPENQIINWKIKFGTANKKPKNGNILTIITRAKTIMYAAEKSGTQIRFVSHEKKEIFPK
jgi:PleD family two-component response regulator